MGVLKLRRDQRSNPASYLPLSIDAIDFTPDATKGKQQDYLKITLSIQSSLLTDFGLDKLQGELLLDGCEPPNRFEIGSGVVIRKAGLKTEWRYIIVGLSINTMDYIQLKRQQEGGINASVTLKGYRKCKEVISLQKSSGYSQVQLFPSN